MEQETEPLAIKYDWDYETITSEIPALQDYITNNKDLRRLSEKISSSLHFILKKLKPMVHINFGKKKNLFSMKEDELALVSPEKLVDYFNIIAKSLIDMVKKGTLQKEEILDVTVFLSRFALLICRMNMYAPK